MSVCPHCARAISQPAYVLVQEVLTDGTPILAYDAHNLILYVQIHQLFRIFLLPRVMAANVRLVTVLKLTPMTTYSPLAEDGSQRTKYVIQSQNDLYQTTEFFKFFSVFRIAWLGLFMWQLMATFMCMIAQFIFAPMTWWEEDHPGRNLESRSEIRRTDGGQKKTEVEKLD